MQPMMIEKYCQADSISLDIGAHIRTCTLKLAPYSIWVYVFVL